MARDCGLGPGFGLPSFAFFSSASIWFRSHFETRNTVRNALSDTAAFADHKSSAPLGGKILTLTWRLSYPKQGFHPHRGKASFMLVNA